RTLPRRPPRSSRRPNALGWTAYKSNSTMRCDSCVGPGSRENAACRSALIDVLINAGASVDGRSVYQGRFGTHSDSAIYNANLAAAEHLIKLGAPLTLTTALCLERWADV